MKYLIVVSICFYSIALYSQPDSGNAFYLPQMKITQKENGKTVIYDFVKEKNMFIVTDRFLFADPDKYKYNVNIENIKKISIRDGSYFWKLAGIGAAVGGAFGILIGIGFSYAFRQVDEDVQFNPAAYLLAGIVCAIPTGLILGLFGAANPYFESYSVDSGNLLNRKNTIINAFKKHGKRKVRIIK